MAAPGSPPRRVTAQTARIVVGTPAEVDALWFDPARWPTWREGLVRVTSVADGWPAAGGWVEWDATGGGRERTRERMRAREPGVRAEIELEDARFESVQWVDFSVPASGQVRLDLSLDFRLKERAPLTIVREWAHIRGLMAGTMRRSLVRFARELDADRELR